MNRRAKKIAAQGVYEMDNYKKIFWILGFLTIFFGSVAASETNAATLYVSTTGNDSNPGTLNSPVATISRANALASPGDTIYLRGGQHNPARYIYVDKDGLTFSSYPGESASIVTNNTDNSTFPYVFFLGGDNITLKNLEIRGGETY